MRKESIRGVRDTLGRMESGSDRTVEKMMTKEETLRSAGWAYFSSSHSSSLAPFPDIQTRAIPMIMTTIPTIPVIMSTGP